MNQSEENSKYEDPLRKDSNQDSPENNSKEISLADETSEYDQYEGMPAEVGSNARKAIKEDGEEFDAAYVEAGSGNKSAEEQNIDQAIRSSEGSYVLEVEKGLPPQSQNDIEDKDDFNLKQGKATKHS